MDRNLRAFLAVARQGNLTAASQTIGLTQPALTKTIRRLEDELGATLFDRSVKGMTLNDFGQKFLPRAQSIENEYRQTMEELDARRTGHKVRLRIDVGVSYHSHIATSLLARLHAEFPTTAMELSTETADLSLPRLISGDIDMLLGAFFMPPPPDIVTRFLFPVRILFYAAKNHPLAGKAEVALADLARYPFVTFRRDGQMMERLLRAFADALVPPPQVALTVHSTEACLQVARESQAITAASDILRPQAEAMDLAALTLEQPFWEFPSGVWVRRSSTGYPIIQRAIILLEELCASPTHNRSE